MVTTQLTNIISSSEFFRSNWTTWKLLGVTLMLKGISNPRVQTQSNAYILWAIVANVLATLSFPFHLGLGIFQSESQAVFFEAISITVTSIGASLKTLVFVIKMKTIKEMEGILSLLDARITQEDEKKYFREAFRHRVAQVQNLFVAVYISVGIVASIAFLSRKERLLLHPGWFPLDWRHSRWNYTVAIIYELVGTALQILQNYTNDSFSPKALSVLSGHIKLLYIRMSRIGHDCDSCLKRGKSSVEEQEKELSRCVTDHKNLYDLFEVMQDIISWPMFLQIFVSVANSCFAAVALLFFVTDTIDRIYYVNYIAALFVQLFPTCYYGSDFAFLFEELPYAVFSSNWIGQKKSFKRNMMIFTQRSLRKNVAVAGRIFPIHLDTFFAACKSAYSLFALVITMK